MKILQSFLSLFIIVIILGIGTSPLLTVEGAGESDDGGGGHGPGGVQCPNPSIVANISSSFLSYSATDSNNTRTYNIFTSNQKNATIQSVCIFPEGGPGPNMPIVYPNGWVGHRNPTKMLYHFGGYPAPTVLLMNGTSQLLGSVQWSGQIPNDSHVLAYVNWVSMCPGLYGSSYCSSVTNVNGSAGASGGSCEDSNSTETDSCSGGGSDGNTNNTGGGCGDNNSGADSCNSGSSGGSGSDKGGGCQGGYNCGNGGGGDEGQGSVAQNGSFWVALTETQKTMSSLQTYVPPSLVSANVTIFAPLAANMILLQANVGINGRQFSTNFYEGAVPVFGMLPNGNYGYLGYYRSMFGAISGCQQGHNITVNVTYNESSVSQTGTCPALSKTVTFNYTFPG